MAEISQLAENLEPCQGYLLYDWSSPQGYSMIFTSLQHWSKVYNVFSSLRARSLYPTVDDPADKLKIGPTRKKYWCISFYFIFPSDMAWRCPQIIHFPGKKTTKKMQLDVGSEPYLSRAVAICLLSGHISY